MSFYYKYVSLLLLLLLLLSSRSVSAVEMGGCLQFLAAKTSLNGLQHIVTYTVSQIDPHERASRS